MDDDAKRIARRSARARAQDARVTRCTVCGAWQYNGTCHTPGCAERLAAR